MFVHTVLIGLLLSQPKPDVDVSKFKDKLKALTDGAGHYVVYDGERPYNSMFYGDAKRVVQVRIHGGGMSGTEKWSAYLWDPRIPHVDGNVATVEMVDSGKQYTMTCGKRVTTLKPVTGADLATLLGAVTFGAPPWDRQPERLLRDDNGVYYLVDRYRSDDRLDRRDFRLFVGPRGKMKQMPLKDVVDDSEGMIFSTKGGELRLVFGHNGRADDNKPLVDQFKWIEGKKSQQLTDVPLDLPINGRLIYMDLGPYAGARLGTPCDDFM
jgi:hypothetical protein